MAWFSKLPTDPITVIPINDWVAIYVGDKLVHWHDSMSGDELLTELGFNVEYLDTEEESGLDLIEDTNKQPGIVSSLAQLRKNIAAAQERKLQAEIDAKQAELDSLKSRKKGERNAR